MSGRPVSRGAPVARNLRGRRFQALVLALALVAAALVARPLAITRTGVAVLAVVDITGSMNTRDYTADGRPESRIDVAKAALRRLAADLPCGSRVALGLFTERRPFLLFEPVEVCADFAPLDGALAALDWRMAWEGDSRIAAGLDRALALAAGLGVDLLFVTDGQETPPLPAGRRPTFDAEPGAVRGLIVGAGGYSLAPIPKFDDRGRERGFYAETDVQQENRFGPPPADAETRAGYNPRNAPATGLAYAHLDGPDGLRAPLLAAATPRPLPGRVDLRPFLAAAALILLLGVLLAAPLSALGRGRIPVTRPRSA